METIPRYLSRSLERLPSKFQSEDFLNESKHRSRRFTPRSFLLTLIRLCGFMNKEGYDHALTKVFGVEAAPRKSAFSQFRRLVSFRFILRILTQVLADFGPHRAHYQGMRLYAVDGWQLTLPRSADIVAAGYTGRATSRYRESYMPKGYITHAYDVLSETTKAIAFNSSATELADALSFIESFEKNSITLYDRAYFSRALCSAHFKAGNFFIARCRSTANLKISAFFTDDASEEASFFHNHEGKAKKIWLIKVINPKAKQPTLFATNLPRQWRNKNSLDCLYQLRWGAETSFYELSETMKLQQWHAKSYNGILQEFYTTLLIINLTKIISYFARGQRSIDPMKPAYQKANFKLLMNYLVDYVSSRKPNLSNLVNAFQIMIKKTSESRKRRTRTHPREIKRPASPYPYTGTEWRWDKAFNLN